MTIILFIIIIYGTIYHPTEVDTVRYLHGVMAEKMVYTFYSISGSSQHVVSAWERPGNC